MPSDGLAEHCIGGRDWTSYSPSSRYSNSAQMTFHLPASSDALYLLARGSLASGSVIILSSDDDRDTIQIDVDVNYHNQNALNHANVCSLQRKSSEIGIGIFVSYLMSVKIDFVHILQTPPVWVHGSSKGVLKFNITVYLPVRNAHLRINAFETDLPLFRHDVGDLGGAIEFGRLTLTGSNEPIVVGVSVAVSYVLYYSSHGFC
jgi:hypothetical protein